MLNAWGEGKQIQRSEKWDGEGIGEKVESRRKGVKREIEKGEEEKRRRG